MFNSCSLFVKFNANKKYYATLYTQNCFSAVAFRKVEYLAPLIVNKSSYETTPFLSRNDSSPGNRCDTFLREFAIMYHHNCIGDIKRIEAKGCQFSTYRARKVKLNQIFWYKFRSVSAKVARRSSTTRARNELKPELAQ
ncbi:hypothetical protein TNCV_1554401 [Trichonephila clavipes]|nr:hypothetical protein TNCV_1554401 [Trichonephila clavipes]